METNSQCHENKKSNIQPFNCLQLFWKHISVNRPVVFQSYLQSLKSSQAVKRSGGDPADEITAEISTETQREENETSVTQIQSFCLTTIPLLHIFNTRDLFL